MSSRCRSFSLRAAVVLAAALFLAPALVQAQPAGAGEGGLRAFRSDADLRRFLARHLPRPSPMPTPSYGAYAGAVPPPPPSPPPPPPPPAAAPSMAADSAGYGRAAENSAASTAPGGGITNNQVAGVDEGDIVKLRGDLLVVLRRGRLFTVSIARGGLRPVSQIDITPPGARASGSDYYDEMLITADRVIVIGYSYRHGGTDIYRFRIDRSGKLAYEDAYQLRSGDYYSERNYASRMIGNRLVLYTPLPLRWQADPLQGLPGIRRWRETDDRAGYRRIAGGRNIYIPATFAAADNIDISTLHSVTTCDVTAPTLDCTATGVLGSDGRSFYVSQSAVYLWTDGAWSGRYHAGRANAFLYRMPLGGGRPGALQTQGMPIDQFSFNEEPATGVINVLVRSEGGGDAMWRAEFNSGALALLRAPLAAFGDGGRSAPRYMYRLLPQVGGGAPLHVRYVGDYLLYGAALSGDGERSAGQGGIWAVPVRGGPLTSLSLPHAVDRIESLGRDAVVVGSTNNAVTFSTIELSTADRPQLGDRYVRRGASEGENRSHGFFYRPDPGADGADGVLGLPIAKPGSSRFQSLFSESAAMVYLRRDRRRLFPLGELEASTTGLRDDYCVASCNDWYGNARPIFVGDRIFALLGYELVEGQIEGRTITEIGRLDFTPARNAPE